MKKTVFNIVLLVGFFVICFGIYQIGTVTFLAKNMKHIDDSWVYSIYEESIGHFESYYENSSVTLIGKITVYYTIDYAISNSTTIFEKDISDELEVLKNMGYNYIYLFDNEVLPLYAKFYYPYSNEVETFKIKLHHWNLTSQQKWYWTMESKGDSQTAIIFSSFPTIIIGLIIMILGWVGSMAQKKKQEALKLEEYLQSTKEQQKITINSSLFKFCTECGTKNKHEYKYCLMCGKKI